MIPKTLNRKLTTVNLCAYAVIEDKKFSSITYYNAVRDLRKTLEIYNNLADKLYELVVVQTLLKNSVKYIINGDINIYKLYLKDFTNT